MMVANASKAMRLPEAVTIRHGPAQLLSRFFLKADEYIRDRGVRLFVRHDMDELLRLNREQTAAGTWYPLPGAYNSELNDLNRDNAYWLEGLNEAGERVVAQSVRLYRWGTSSLADNAVPLIYGDFGEPGPCEVDCPTAHLVRGVVGFAGALWIRPDYRRLGLGGFMSQVSRAYAMTTWGTEWVVCYIKREQVALKMHEAYGYSDVDFAIRYPGSPLGDLDLALARQHALELLARVEDFVNSGAVVGRVRAA